MPKSDKELSKAKKTTTPKKVVTNKVASKKATVSKSTAQKATPKSVPLKKIVQENKKTKSKSLKRLVLAGLAGIVLLGTLFLGLQGEMFKGSFRGPRIDPRLDPRLDEISASKKYTAQKEECEQKQGTWNSDSKECLDLPCGSQSDAEMCPEGAPIESEDEIEDPLIILKSPSHQASHLDYLPTFKWETENLPDSALIKLEISTTESFQNPQYQFTLPVDTNNLTLYHPLLDENTKYYWRIKLFDSNSAPLLSSSVNSFTTQKATTPQIISPRQTKDLDPNNILIEWEADTEPAHKNNMNYYIHIYEILENVVSGANPLSQSVFSSGATQDTTYSLKNELKPGKKYKLTISSERESHYSTLEKYLQDFSNNNEGINLSLSPLNTTQEPNGSDPRYIKINQLYEEVRGITPEPYRYPPITFTTKAVTTPDRTPQDSTPLFTQTVPKKATVGDTANIKVSFSDNDFPFYLVQLRDAKTDKLVKNLALRCSPDTEVDRVKTLCEDKGYDHDVFEGPKSITIKLKTDKLQAKSYTVKTTAVSETDRQLTNTKTLDLVLPSGSSQPGSRPGREDLPNRNCSEYFVDIAPNHPQCEMLTHLRERGIFLGQNTVHGPVADLNQRLLRSEFFALATRLLGRENSQHMNVQFLNKFTDLPPARINDPVNRWWLVAVSQLEGIIRGYGEDGSLRPTNVVTGFEVGKVAAESRIRGFRNNDSREPWYADVADFYARYNVLLSNTQISRGQAIDIIYKTLLIEDGLLMPRGGQPYGTADPYNNPYGNTPYGQQQPYADPYAPYGNTPYGQQQPYADPYAPYGQQPNTPYGAYGNPYNSGYYY